MKLKRFAVTALIAAASTSVMTGTANGAPVDPRPGGEHAAAAVQPARGTESGVDYTLTSSAEAEPSIHVAVNGGRFALNGDRLDISNESGQLIGQVPLRFGMAGQVVSFTARIADSDRVVTIASAGPAETNTGIAQEPLTPEQRMYCSNATVGTAIGGVIGLIIGFPLLLPGMLVGLIIGGLVGMSIAMSAPMPGIPATDLMTKYIRCQQGMSPLGG